MNKTPTETFHEGCRILEPLMKAHGFSLKNEQAGRGSGGPYASGSYVNGERELELHFRYSLGLVTYHFGQLEIGHEFYMCAVTGTNGKNKYPGFSDDPLDAFRDLAFDLEHFGNAFLDGDLVEFSRFATVADEMKKVPGFARLP